MIEKEKILNRCGEVICSWCKTKYNYEHWNKEKKCDECGQETLYVWISDLTLYEFEQYGKEQFEAGAKAQHDADEELVDGCDNIYEALVKLSDNLLISEKQNDEQ